VLSVVVRGKRAHHDVVCLVERESPFLLLLHVIFNASHARVELSSLLSQAIECCFASSLVPLQVLRWSVVPAIIVALFIGCPLTNAAPVSGFVKVCGTQFCLDERPWVRGT
jgi:hypothetical protein